MRCARFFGLALLALGAGAPLAGCQPAAPEVLEVRVPDDTRDRQGPYRVSALVRGVVDAARLEWAIGDGPPQRVTLRRRGDGLFTADLPGAPPGSRVQLRVEVTGPGGRAQAPAEGFFRFSVLGGDGSCLVDGECEAGEICDRLRGRCKPRPERCQDDGDCPQDLVCPGPDGVCRFAPPECQVDADCGGGRCRSGRCQAPPECLEDADCGPGAVCQAERCRPAPECQDDTDCGPGARCEGERCVPGPPECAEDGDCGGPGLRCAAGRCVAVDACGGCPAGLRCAPEPLSACVECFADGHCPDGACDTARGVCGPEPRGRHCAPCGPGDACGPELVCARFDEGLAVCLLPCGPDGACPAGLACNGALCEPFEFCAGAACRRDEACPSGVCQGGVCEARQLCREDADCAADRRCVEGGCRPRAPLCGSAADCAPGTGCLAGRCVESPPQAACTPCEAGGACDAVGYCARLDEAEPQPYCLPACGRAGCGPEAECFDFVQGLSLCFPLALCQGAGCAPDAFEPNDRLERATPTAAGFEAALTACGDPDLFRLPAEAVEVALGSQDATLELVLLDAQQRQVDRGRLGPGEAAALEGVPGGWLQVTALAGGEGRYRLEIRGAPAGPCPDDLFEPNDSQREAVAIRFGADIGAVACPGSPDWFELRLRGREEGLLTVNADGPGRPRVALQDGDGRAIFGPAGLEVGSGIGLPIFANERGLFLRLECQDCPAPARYRITVTR